jgi:3-dehydroquinate synthase
VDLAHAKNFVGAFYQPRLVYNNLSLLRSLPMRQRRSGLAEIIKYGVIADAALFRFVERNLAACLALHPRAVRTLVERSCAIKARVVTQDERETRGVRAQLNFGHTLGHALEAAGRCRRWTHGEAIAIGMCAATELGVELGICSPRVLTQVAGLLGASGLPTRAGRIGLHAVWRAMRYDKKFIHGRPRWVLPTRIGRVVLTEQVPEAVTRRVVLKYLR